MIMSMSKILLLIPILPLVAAAVVGLFGRKMPRHNAHYITVGAVGMAFLLSAYVFNQTLHGFTLNETVYRWLSSGPINFEVGFLIDNLTAMMVDKRFHLILNIAVGGTYGGQMGIDDSIFPQSMVVDYVRVYQKK